jgi:hypothetical protein
MSRISTGWKIAKQSFTVIKHDKEILLFPILSAITTILVVLGIIFLGFGFDLATNSSEYSGLLMLAIIIVSIYFISTFFQAAIITSATIRFSGKNPSFSDGLKGPSKKILTLLAWASINALVGTILEVLKRSSRNRSRGINIGTQIGAGIIGMAWSLITFFTIPAILFENKSAISSIKSSSYLFKKTWGENVTSQFSIGLIFFLLSVPFIILMFLAMLTESIHFIITSAVILVLVIITLNIMSSSANAILKASLYQYAVTGKMPKIYDESTVRNMFVKK